MGGGEGEGEGGVVWIFLKSKKNWYYYWHILGENPTVRWVLILAPPVSQRTPQLNKNKT